MNPWIVDTAIARNTVVLTEPSNSQMVGYSDVILGPRDQVPIGRITGQARTEAHFSVNQELDAIWNRIQYACSSDKGDGSAIPFARVRGTRRFGL
jgi:hypothetical protein